MYDNTYLPRNFIPNDPAPNFPIYVCNIPLKKKMDK